MWFLIAFIKYRDSRRSSPLALSLLAGLVMIAGTVQAEDRALLIGVGDYQIGSASLPGIEHDLRLMNEVATRFGYEPNRSKCCRIIEPPWPQ